jgi:hypothetical protein
MTISDAQPVQFWLVECNTYNEQESDGVHYKCFSAPWNCDDEITIQFIANPDTSPELPDEYSLIVIDEDNNELMSIPFDYQFDGTNYVFYLTLIPSDQTPDLCNRLIKLEIFNETTATTEAKSDALDIQDSHSDTVLINYYNHRNFAGLIYQSTSPDFEFNIRIPAIFYHQRFPEEDETMVLSSSLVSLNGEIKKQKLLDIAYVPYYFHEKIKLVLKHQFVTIENKQWVKQEPYEISEGDRRWPVKKAKCWINQKDFVHRNVL